MTPSDPFFERIKRLVEDSENPPFKKDLPDGRSVWVQERLYNSLVIIGRYNDLEYDTHWCYKTMDEAISYATVWNPLTEKEPDGWFRHASSGRRRPGGDKSKEYVDR